MNVLNISHSARASLLQSAHRNDHERFQRSLNGLAEDYNVARGLILLSCSGQDRGTVLHKAAEFDHEEILDVVIQDNTWPAMPAQRLSFLAQKDVDGNQAAHIAAENGSLKILTRLVAMGTPLDVPNLARRTPLLLAVSARLDAASQAVKDTHLDTIKFLLRQHVNINTTSAIGDTSLHLATRQADEVLARLLLTSGANVNARDGVEAPIHIAARMGSVRMVRCLLDHAADPNIVTRQGDAALHVALRASDLRFVVNIIEALIAHGGSTTQTNINGLTVWELARLKGIEEVHAFFLYHYGGR